MKVSGFTIVRNAVKYDYPVVESILSILPVVDEMIVSVGDSEDETLALIESIGDPKIKIIRSTWDDSLREGGKVLAVETNKAKAAADPQSDWLFYIQADEVVHEKYHHEIRQAMEQYRDDERVDGLLFKYAHFYGSFRFLGDSRKWYHHEIRVIRNRPDIYSYRDAQGFRKQNDQKLRVKAIDAEIYHYGWVRNPVFMQLKNRDFGRLWRSDAEHEQWVDQQKLAKPAFDYSQIDSVSLFNGTHPVVMKGRVAAENWAFSMEAGQKNFKDFKSRLLYWIQQYTGWQPFEYRNYIKI
jgi:glycosyltransferase involved in cell wall biosynthesis